MLGKMGTSVPSSVNPPGNRGQGSTKNSCGARPHILYHERTHVRPICFQETRASVRLLARGKVERGSRFSGFVRRRYWKRYFGRRGTRARAPRSIRPRRAFDEPRRDASLLILERIFHFQFRHWTDTHG